MINASIPNIDPTAYTTFDTGTISSTRPSATFCNGLKEEFKKIVREEIDTSNKVLMTDKNGIPKWSEPPKEDNIFKNCKKVNPVVEEHTVEVKPEKSKEDIKMKKFLKKAFIAVFVAIGIFSTVNYFTNDKLVPIIYNTFETVTDKTSSFWITISSNGKYHGSRWNSYTPEYKLKVFNALTLKNKLELMEFLKSGVNEEIESFKNNIK